MGRDVGKESALRMAVRTLLEDKSLGPAMINVNPVVDPSAAVTDPTNQNFSPGSKQELMVALQAMVDQIPDTGVVDFYEHVKDNPKKDKEDKEMQKRSKSKVEESIRLAIRKILAEANPSLPVSNQPTIKPTVYGMGISGRKPGSRGGPPTPAQRAELEKELNRSFLEDEEIKSSKKNLMMTDVGGVGLAELAKEFGFKNPNGVLQWINKILAKLRIRMENPEQLRVLTLEALQEYIEELAETSEMPEEEKQMMKDNPDIVEDLETFKIYLKNKLAKAGM